MNKKTQYNWTGAEDYVLDSGWDYTQVADTAIKGVSEADDDLLTPAQSDALRTFCVRRVAEHRGVVLTIPGYWHGLAISTKAYWVKKALRTLSIQCTDRPDARQYRGLTPVGRASTGGRWGQSCDRRNLDLCALLRAGYILI